MKSIIDVMKQRRSVRTYDGNEVSATDMESLEAFVKKVENPYNIPVSFKFLNAERDGLSCPVVNGTNLYIGGKIEAGHFANAAFGYSFEKLILHAHSLGLGTVWLGGTMNRSAYEKAMELEENEIMPCASSLGYPADKLSVKEAIMRKAIKADERRAFEKTFFNGDFDTPLVREAAGALALPFEMVRLAPSAVNRQPWRVVLQNNAVHFYLKRSKGVSHSEIDMQMVDIGIALCHFESAATELGIKTTFSLNEPKTDPHGAEYVATYFIEE